MAVVAAAETAANLALTLSSEESDFGGDGFTKPKELDFRRGMILATPEGWKPSQIKAEQPTTTYADFKRELLGEIGRSLQVPVNIVTGDSSRSNYASGRLDHQEFQKAIRLDQTNAALVVMRPIFRAWFSEYAILNDLRRDCPASTWYWDGFEHVDPVKEANAQAIRLANCTTTLAAEYGKQGRDWEDELVQYARERARMKELGLPVPGSVEPIEDEEDERT